MKNVFTEQMTFFVRVFQGFGLFPSNFFLKIYSALTFVTTCGIFISAFFIFPVLSEENSLSLLVGGLVFVGILLTHMMNVIQAFTSRHQQAEIYLKFDEIDILLSNQLLVTVDYKFVKRKLLMKYLGISVILVTIHILSIISVSINGLFFNYYIHLIFPVAIIRFRCIQNMFYIDLIKEKLQLLNFKLQKEATVPQNDRLFIVSEKFQKREKKAITSTLVIMKTIYGKIWDITNLCNDCFGYSLLFIVSENNFVNGI